MAFRIFFSTILLLSVLFLPFIVSASLAVIGMLYFPFFVESIIVLFLSDFLYGVPEVKFFHVAFASGVITVVVFIFIEFLKKKLKFYPS